MKQFITVQEAQQLIAQEARGWGTETVLLQNSFQRTLAATIMADRDYPPFNRAAMDGIAIRSEDFLDLKLTSFHIVAELLAGTSTPHILDAGQCFRIMTGAAVPSCANAVVKIEDCVLKDTTAVIAPDTKIRPWLNIALQGEDAKAKQAILQKGTLINATVLAALASVGKYEVSVLKKPSVAIIATGNEIVNVDAAAKPHQIRNSNTYALLGLLQSLGIEVTQHHLVDDDLGRLEQTLQAAMGCDVVIITGGVSMGTADYVPQVLEANGVRPIFHKVKIKPGKPIWFGSNGYTTVFALPGNPMSVQTTFQVFVAPYLQLGMQQTPKPAIYLPLAIAKKQRVALDEYFPCTLVGQPSSVLPLPHNGSGDIISNIAAHGIARHVADSGNLAAGVAVEYIAW